MNIPRPFDRAFKRKPIFRGSEWRQPFYLWNEDEATGQRTAVSLAGYTVKLTIEGLDSIDFDTIVKEYTPVNNGFVLTITASEQLTLIPAFSEPQITRPIEVVLYKTGERWILIRDVIEIYSTIGDSTGDATS